MVAETQRLAPGRRRLRDILGPAPLRPPAFVVVAVSVGVLNTVGLVMILSASSVAALRSYGSSWYFFNRQLAWSIVGLAVFILAARIDYRRWMKLALPLLLVACATLILVLVPQVGIRVDGARRWLGVGALRFQPSELAKLALLVFAATVLTRRADSVEDFSRGAKPVIAVFLGFAALVLVEPDLDSTIVLALIALSVLAVGASR
ncbi:MAG: FtsW/RodA/SpoVE family cell cycle protein [Acidimicrobiia bacterium]|nr:FtsW/RodA/SpoVE family cell cycle protein [Acidimicrobiia bacterium]